MARKTPSRIRLLANRYADTTGESWCDWTHADYPHEAGRLHDCLACQTRCYCDSEPDAEECVHCALVESGESTCDETSGCGAHS